MSLELNLAICVLTGWPFYADDVTANGQVTVDATHAPNGKQSGIGSLFSKHSKAKHIRKTGKFKNSDSPHRKGGANYEWEGTPEGQRWAQQYINDHAPKRKTIRRQPRATV